MRFELAAAFFIGSIWGSFFHTLALRELSGELKANPLKSLFSRSKCPKCGVPINPLFMIPVAGYFFSLGRCRACGEKISPSYPAFELIHGLIAFAAVNAGGIAVTSVIAYFILACALTASWIDIESMTIPDYLSGAILLLGVYPAIAGSALLDSFIGLAFMAAVFIVILLIFPGSFGGGDLKFAAACGFFLGREMSVVMLEAALISGSIAGIIYAVAAKKGFRSKIPFGPFLAAGLFTAHFFGGDIVLLYYGLID